MLKDSKQTEFHELFNEALKINQALKKQDIADVVGVKPPSVSNWLNGSRTPEEPKLMLMRRFVQDLRRSGPTAYPAGPVESVEGMKSEEVKADARKLEEIHASDPEKYQSLRHMIGMTHETISQPKYPPAKKKSVSSDLPSDFADRVERAHAGRKKKAPDHPRRVP